MILDEKIIDWGDLKGSKVSYDIFNKYSKDVKVNQSVEYSLDKDRDGEGDIDVSFSRMKDLCITTYFDADKDVYFKASIHCVKGKAFPFSVSTSGGKIVYFDTWNKKLVDNKHNKKVKKYKVTTRNPDLVYALLGIIDYGMKFIEKQMSQYPVVNTEYMEI